MRRLLRAGHDDAGHARATARLAAEVQDAERSAALHAEAGATFEKVGLRNEAAVAYRAVLDRTPLDGGAFNRARALLQVLHAESRQPGPLVELYTHRLTHVQDPGDRTGLLLDRAEVLAGEGDREGAERDLRAVLELNREHLGAMRRLAELLGASPAGRVEAVALLTRYLSLENGTEHRRAALLRLSELEDLPGGKPDEASRHLEAAIELAATPLASLGDTDRLASLFTRQRHWQKAVQTLGRVVELTADGPARAHVEIRIAAIYKDGFSDARAAVEALMRALKSAPLELEALEKLVGFADAKQVVQLELDDRLDKAIDVARRGVNAHPDDPLHYRALTRLWGWRGDEDARIVAAQALALASADLPLSRDDGIDPTKELTPAGWERLLPEVARSVALEIWRTAGEASMKIYGPQLDALGVSKAERVNPKTLPANWSHVDKIMRAVGCTGYELYGSRDRDACTTGANGDTPVMVCGGSFADKLMPALRFRLAREAMLLRNRLGPLEKLDDEELALFFAACAKVAEVPRPASVRVPSEAKLEERARAVNKALGRRERKLLTALGARWSDLPEPASWRRQILDGATRFALVVAGDLGATLSVLELEAKDARARTLINFALSDEYLALRREMGLRS